MTNYTIVEPGFEFIEPPNQDNYLEFLELCTRNCYKSEDKIGPGTAEKLLTKVVNEYKHLSVTEHLNCIFLIRTNHMPAEYASGIQHYNPLLHISSLPNQDLLVSGNIRMWTDYLARARGFYKLADEIEDILARKFPFFFKENYRYSGEVECIDENPLTNRECLKPNQMARHMTLTCRIIGDRSMSHQLVRHRLAAYSQESQRYCNYGKKGFQFVVPPSASAEGPRGYPTARNVFIDRAIQAYNNYLEMLDYGLKPEDARGLMPNCCKTEIITTYTLDIWKHIFEHRANNPKAQWQIRSIMQGIQAKFKELLPEVFNGHEPVEDESPEG